MQGSTKSIAESTAWSIAALGCLLLGACARGGGAEQRTGTEPSPDALSTWIIPPAAPVTNLRIEGDKLRYSNGILEVAQIIRGGEKLRVPAGRLHVTGKLLYSTTVAELGTAEERHALTAPKEAPLDLTFIAQPQRTYTLEVLGDGLPVIPSGPTAISEGRLNLGGGAAPRTIRLGVTGARGERIVLIEPKGTAPAAPEAPAQTIPDTTPRIKPGLRRLNPNAK